MKRDLAALGALLVAIAAVVVLLVSGGVLGGSTVEPVETGPLPEVDLGAPARPLEDFSLASIAPRDRDDRGRRDGGEGRSPDDTAASSDPSADTAATGRRLAAVQDGEQPLAAAGAGPGAGAGAPAGNRPAAGGGDRGAPGAGGSPRDRGDDVPDNSGPGNAGDRPAEDNSGPGNGRPDGVGDNEGENGSGDGSPGQGRGRGRGRSGEGPGSRSSADEAAASRSESRGRSPTSEDGGPGRSDED